MKKLICLSALAGVLFLISGCGNSEPQIDTAPFNKAIATYLSEKHMDMKVSKFKEVKINGDKATAKCSMKEASGISAGIPVFWEFTFEKKDGKWKAVNYKQ